MMKVNQSTGRYSFGVLPPYAWTTPVPDPDPPAASAVGSLEAVGFPGDTGGFGFWAAITASRGFCGAPDGLSPGVFGFDIGWVKKQDRSGLVRSRRGAVSGVSR